MAMLIASGLFFIGIHVFISSTPLRGWLIARIGVRPYQAGFSLLSLGGIIWMVMAYNTAERTVLWRPAGLVALIAIAAIILAVGLAVIGTLSPNPTTVDQEGLLRSASPARGIVRITRHPFMIGVTLWGAAHIVANGDSASLIFFGAFFALAAMAPWLIDRKRKQAFAQDWQGFAAVTSTLPFAAILAGRNRLVLSEIGWWRPVAAIVIVGGLVYLHGFLFGVPLI